MLSLAKFSYWIINLLIVLLLLLLLCHHVQTDLIKNQSFYFRIKAMYSLWQGLSTGWAVNRSLPIPDFK